MAKGTGATLAQVPDGTVAGGNKRGIFATDWQKQRDFAFHVASGNNSIVCGGKSNTASSNFSFVGGGDANSAGTGSYPAVVGGQSNSASSAYSFIGGGQSNLAQTNTHAAVCGGSSNTASGQYAFVGGGNLNTASGAYSSVNGGQANTSSNFFAFIGGGANNIAGAVCSTVCGGENNSANGQWSFIGGGRYGIVRGIVGYHVFPACNSPIVSASGVTQSALLLLGRQTTDATSTVLASDGSAPATTNQVTLPNNSAYFFKGSVIAGVTGAGNTKAWEFRGAIKRGANAAATSIVGSVIKDVIASDAGASTWDITITADTTNGAIAVTVTGEASTTIRWVCKIETTEMTY